MLFVFLIISLHVTRNGTPLNRLMKLKPASLHLKRAVVSARRIWLA